MRIKKKISEKEVLQTAKWFDFMETPLCIMFYNLCNGVNIESTTMSNFIDWMNLKNPNPPISVLPGEKTRCCYFIKQASEHLINKQFKDTWISMVLKKAGISESHYKSHNYEVGIDKSNEKDIMLIKGIPEAVKKANCFKSQLLSL